MSGQILDNVEKCIGVVRARLDRAQRAARDLDGEHRLVGLTSPSLSPGGRSSDSTSVVERVVLSSSADPAVREFNQREIAVALSQLDAAALRLQSLVLKYSPPVAVNDGDRVRYKCNNVHGCPSDEWAKRELSGRCLCEKCWQFESTHQRHRTAADVAEAEERRRAATAERVAALRSAT